MHTDKAAVLVTGDLQAVKLRVWLQDVLHGICDAIMTCVASLTAI